MISFLPMVTPLVAIALAVFGWLIITRLAKRRESYDLCHAILNSLDRLKKDLPEAWSSEIEFLDEYKEQHLTACMADLELRLGLLKKHYHSISVDSSAIFHIRRLLTAPDLLIAEYGNRYLAFHQVASQMAVDLLRDNYEFINQPIVKLTKFR